jgi:predicted nuclease of predicted toxin-antitoxin system
MKGYVLDENVPGQLMFQPSLPIFSSCNAVGRSATDSELWGYARERELVIITKDADFSARILMSVPPPWIVHLRFGNLPRKAFHRLLSSMWPHIEALLPQHKMIAVYIDRIEAVH